jgi:predicted Zn-dependent peptidase
MNPINRYRLNNGLILLIETMPGVQSVAMSFRLPAGAACQPTDQRGVNAVLSEMLFRGAGDRDARAHSDALDQLGIKRGCDVQTHHMLLTAAMLGDRLEEGLPLLADMVTAPQLTDAAFEPSRDLALQSIAALDDEPDQKAMVELKRRHFGNPLGWSTLGKADHIERLAAEQVRRFHAERFVPDGAILSLAGHVQPERARDLVERLLGDWQGQAELPMDTQPPSHEYHHITAPSAQQHIGMACDAVSEDHPDAATQRIAVAVLSGGMSGRLFTEVREKRGLCYAVYASYLALRKRGGIFAYAGTTVERAAETLEVLEQELRRISQGAEADEFDRARVGLKSRLVMQGESTQARAAALTSDQYLLDEPRTLEQRTAEIDAVSLDDLNAFLEKTGSMQFTTLSIGPGPLRGDEA